MGNILEKTIGGQLFRFSPLNADQAMDHAGRAFALYASIGEVAEHGGGGGGILRAFAERMTAGETRFWKGLLFPLIELLDDRGGSIPLQKAAEGGLIRGGVPALMELLLVGMDHSCGPFERAADMFRVLRPAQAEAESSEP